MEERFDKQTQERAVLVGLNADCFAEEDTATESTLDELEDLLETAGGFCTGKVLQNRHTPDSHSFIGEGTKSSYRRGGLAPRCRLVTSWGWRRSQGLGCSPIKQKLLFS